jgi:galactokinase
MAIDRWTTIAGSRGGSRIELRSDSESVPLDLPLPIADARAVEPSWGRYVAGVAELLGSSLGLSGSVSTTIPVGAGLSSSAALEVAVALALGFDGTAEELARVCQRAENRATGLPSGILDQLTSTCGVEGHALIMDCNSLSLTPFPLPDRVRVQVLFVAHRELVGSPYADRVAQCAAAESIIGPLRLASAADLERISDSTIRRRARHVITENQRVRDFAAALRDDDPAAAGALMLEGHESLRTDFETSTPAMDTVVRDLAATRGVHGARMTGGGFGGCVVALTEPGVDIAGAWVVRAVGGATASRPLL